MPAAPEASLFMPNSMSKTNVTRIQYHPNKGQSVVLPYRLNDVPSIPGDPSAELARVEAEADRVAVVLAGLLTRVNYLKAQINVSKSLFLRMLPSEIIAEIFTLCLEIPGPADEEPGNVDNTVPLKLGAVCNAFRTIAWSTPQLWAAVVLDIKSAWKITAQAALLSDWLQRSGHLPLSIWLNSLEEVHWTFAHPELILKIINVFSKRWKYVDIRLPSSCYRYLPTSDESLPMLEALTLKPPGGQGDREHRIEICDTPNLRCITLQCLYLRSIKFAWHLLTVLHLESFYVDESLEIFRQASNLVQLSIRRILAGDDTHALPSDPIVMSSLSSLTFVNDKAIDLSPMLGRMALPALCDFSFSADGLTYVPCSSITDLVRRSSCTLESLSLKQCSISKFEFETLLSRIPSLKELRLETLNGMTHASLSELAMSDNFLQSLTPSFARENGQHYLLPGLEILTYTGLKEFAWPKMMQMIESRTTGISTSGDPSTSFGPQSDPGSRYPVRVRLKEVNLCLTISTIEEFSALTSIEPPPAQATGLKWSLQAVIKP